MSTKDEINRIHEKRHKLIEEIKDILNDLGNNRNDDNKERVRQKHIPFVNQCPKIWQHICDGNINNTNIFALQYNDQLYKNAFDKIEEQNPESDYNIKRMQANVAIGENLAKKYLYPSFPKSQLPTQKQKEQAYRIIKKKVQQKK